MTGYELSSPVRPGVSALMPPTSQGVEQRPERPAGRTGFRWGLRALVVDGVAGAAGMLSGPAAQAADPARILPGTATHRPTSATVQPVSRLSTVVADTVRSTAGTDTASGGVTRAVRELTAPPRLTGGPVGTTRLPPVTRKVPVASLIRTGPGTDLPQDAAAPATTHGPATAAVPTRPAAAPTGPAAAPDGRDQVTGSARLTAARTAQPAVDPAAGDPVDGDPRTTGGKGTDMRRSTDADRHTAATTARPVGVRPAPGSPEPAPLRVHLGAVSGIPASGPGSPSDGGCPATVRRRHGGMPPVAGRDRRRGPALRRRFPDGLA